MTYKQYDMIHAITEQNYSVLYNCRAMIQNYDNENNEKDFQTSSQTFMPTRRVRTSAAKIVLSQLNTMQMTMQGHAIVNSNCMMQRVMTEKKQSSNQMITIQTMSLCQDITPYPSNTARGHYIIVFAAI